MASPPGPTTDQAETRPRALSPALRIALWVYVALFAVLFILPIGLKIGGLSGHDTATDFIAFYAAAEMTLDGAAATAYDGAHFLSQERALFPGQEKLIPYYYPPSYMLALFWLPLLPYVLSQIAFLAGSFALFFATIRPWLNDRHDFLLVLAAPPVWINVAHGQNAFLIAAIALFAGNRLAAHGTRAGVLLGLLSIKPHLCVLWPFILPALGKWRAIFAGLATTALLVVLSALAFGTEAWAAFFRAGLSSAYTNLSESELILAWIASPHAGMTLLGFSAEAALAAQLICSGLIAAFLVYLCRIGTPLPFILAVAFSAALFVTPHNYPYDWVIVLAGLAITWRQARLTGFLRFECAGLILGYLSPLAIVFSRNLAAPIAPLLALAVILVVARRAWHEAGKARAA